MNVNLIGLCGGAMFLALVPGVASARVNIDLGIGIPGPAYVSPPPVYYEPPPAYYSPPPPVYYGPQVIYDDRRYHDDRGYRHDDRRGDRR